ICWLSGAEGVGKSTIALTIAEECKQDGVVALFFFSKPNSRCNNPSPLILSIAHGPAVTRPHLKDQIEKRI
ncbi:hypothetical protein L218DRAFT_834612, partial [Marasmius fiardii PR-910]